MYHVSIGWDYQARMKLEEQLEKMSQQLSQVGSGDGRNHRIKWRLN
jgi:hypothetical protein